MMKVKTISPSRKAGAQPKSIKSTGQVKRPRSSAPRPQFSKVLD